jgi:hypothetical protein
MVVLFALPPRQGLEAVAYVGGVELLEELLLIPGQLDLLAGVVTLRDDQLRLDEPDPPPRDRASP